MTKQYTWNSVGAEQSTDTAIVDALPDGGYCLSGDADNGSRYSYRFTCDAEGCLREADIHHHATGKTLALRGDGQGRWTDGDGRALDELNGCLDADFAITPATNTLPVRRLKLATGGKAAVRTLYISGDLEVSIDKQTYSRLSDDRYEFTALDGCFMETVTFDADGVVTEYPGLFMRV
jgi:hypothetical protein